MKRVLVVDDSSFMRKSLTQMLESDAAIQVVATAADGAEAVRKVKELRPDVVLLDLEMSGMDGLAALERIMAEQPTPVLVLTGLDRAECDHRGPVPGAGRGGLHPQAVRGDLLRHRQAQDRHHRQGQAGGRGQPRGPGRRPARPAPCARRGPSRWGGPSSSSSGPPPAARGPSARSWPACPLALGAAVLVVQHMGPEFVPSFADRLRLGMSLDVAVAAPGRSLRRRSRLDRAGRLPHAGRADGGRSAIRMDQEASPHALFPSVDYAMESAAAAYGAGAVGVLLTGMGSDGAGGLQAIKEAGGMTVAQDPSTCLVSGMPRAALDLGCVDQVVPCPANGRGSIVGTGLRGSGRPWRTKTSSTSPCSSTTTERRQGRLSDRQPALLALEKDPSQTRAPERGLPGRPHAEELLGDAGVHQHCRAGPLHRRPARPHPQPASCRSTRPPSTSCWRPSMPWKRWSGSVSEGKSEKEQAPAASARMEDLRAQGERPGVAGIAGPPGCDRD